MPFVKKVVAAVEPVVPTAEQESIEAPPVPRLADLSADDLKALCANLNAQIISLHEEGKHEEGDALRVKHMNARDLLRVKSNPLGYA